MASTARIGAAVEGREVIHSPYCTRAGEPIAKSRRVGGVS